MKNKILIFGKGYIGCRLSKFLNCPVTGIHIESIKDIQRQIKKHKPKIIINCIGYIGINNVDDCEKDIDNSLISNTFIPIMMAEACIRNNIKLIHISSGCIYNYDYKKQKPIQETLTPDYYSLFYSRTKIYPENILINLSKKYDILITRIRIPLDNKPHQKNIIEKLVKYKTVINVPNSITYIPNMLKAIKHLIKINAKGIYNITTKGSLKYPDLMDEYRKYFPKFKYTILPLNKLNLNRTNLLLSTRKLEKSGFKVITTKQAIKDCIKHYAANKIR